MADPVYTAHVHTVGGRGGTAKSDNGKLDVTLAYPPALGGDGNGTNPEELFAAGYGACFTGALNAVAKREKVTLGEHSLDVAIHLYKDEPTFKLGASLTLNAPGLDRETKLDLLKKAHEVCPYSKATRGNIEVELLAGD